MNVITNRKVVVRPSAGSATREAKSGLDGKSSKDSIVFFQKWYNRNKGGKLKVDGKWGPKTSAAWNTAGKEYDAAMINAAQGAALFGPPTGSDTPAATKTDPNGRQKPGHFWNTLKGAWQKGKAAVSKGKEIAGKGKAAVDKVQGKPSAGSIGSSDTDASSEKGRDKKKLMIWSGVGLVALITGIVIYKSTRKGK